MFVRLLAAPFGCILLVPLGLGQNVIATVAGGGFAFRGDGRPASAAQLWPVSGVAVDAAKNLFASDPGNNIVVKISPSGLLTVVAGNGLGGLSGDGGPATSASLSLKETGYGSGDIAVDDAGNLYIADSNNARVRKVAPDGTITTVAGGGSQRCCTVGPATSMRFANIKGVAVDKAGNLYLAEPYFKQVFKLDAKRDDYSRRRQRTV